MARKPGHNVRPTVTEGIEADALARYRAKEISAESALSAMPWFQAAARRGQQWESAQRAASDAAAPFDRALKEFIKQNKRGYRPNSAAARKCEALSWAAQDARERAYAAHGFPLAKPPDTPRKLASKLTEMDPDNLMDLVVLGGGTRPVDVWQSESLALWKLAERMRAVDPTLPRLPVRPERGRDRLVTLREWCELCPTSSAEAVKAIREFLAFTHALDTNAGGDRECRDAGPTLERKWGMVCEACNMVRRELVAELPLRAGGMVDLTDLSGKRRELWDLLSLALWKSGLKRFTKDGKPWIEAMAKAPNGAPIGSCVVEKARIKKLQAIVKLIEALEAPVARRGPAAVYGKRDGENGDEPDERLRGLTPGEREVWNCLCGKAMTAEELKAPSAANTSVQTVREHVVAIRRVLGKDSISNKPGYGYFRPGAPPDWNAVKPKRKRRIRPA